MSPISILLRRLRQARKLKQHELAKKLAYEQAYVSAVELGIKNPSAEFLSRMANFLQLTTAEREDIEAALKNSRRRFVLPPDVGPETFRLCAELWEKIDRLHPSQVAALRNVIKLDVEISQAPALHPSLMEAEM